MAITLQVRCLIYLGSFHTAQGLCIQATDLLKKCGLQNTVQDFRLRSHQAHIHLLKTECIDARTISESIARAAENSRLVLDTAFAHHNLAVVGIALDSPPDVILRSLSTAREQFNMVRWPLATPRCDATRADLHLCEGEILQARKMFQLSFAALRHKSMEAADFCLERLADIHSGMSGPHDSWAAIHLASAYRAQNKLAIVKAFRFWGNIFVAQEDDETALNLFRVALDGFISMGIHRWREDCIARIATILDRWRRLTG